jgi:hypothetical protein
MLLRAHRGEGAQARPEPRLQQHSMPGHAAGDHRLDVAEGSSVELRALWMRTMCHAED